MPKLDNLYEHASHLQQYMNRLADRFMENSRAFKEKLNDAFEVASRGSPKNEQNPNGIPHRDTQASTVVEILEILTSTESRDIAVANLAFISPDRKKLIPDLKEDLSKFDDDEMGYRYFLRDVDEIKTLQKLLSKTKSDGHTTVLESLSKPERKQVMNILHSHTIKSIAQIGKEKRLDLDTSLMVITNGIVVLLNPLVRSVNKMPPEVLDSIKEIEDFILEIGSWKSIASVGAKSLFLKADNMSRLLNAAQTIGDLIYEYHGPEAFALTIVPLMLITLLLIPATLCIQLINAIVDATKELESDLDTIEEGERAIAMEATEELQASLARRQRFFAAPSENNSDAANDDLEEDDQNAPR